MNKQIILGTRASNLALVQTQIAKNKIKNLFSSDIKVVRVQTAGDKDKKSPIKNIGGKGIFVKEIEASLLNGNIDIAIHSLKDMPAVIHKDLLIGAYISDSKPHDIIITKDGRNLFSLLKKARIGTGSPRREYQLKLLRPDLNIVPIRGNIETRINKVISGEYDGTILAYAGVERLKLTHLISDSFNPLEFIPSPGQGIIALQIRKKDIDLIDILKDIDNSEQRAISETEFHILDLLQADCTTPVGMYSNLNKDFLKMTFFLGNKNMSQYIKENIQTKLTKPKAMAEDIYKQIRRIDNNGILSYQSES